MGAKKHKGARRALCGFGAVAGAAAAMSAGLCALTAPDARSPEKERLWQYMCCFRYAHRGLYDNNAGVPENSCAAFRAAREAGFGAELDVHLCRDGSLAVIHDSDLTRMCKSPRSIEGMSREEFKATPLLETGECIPEFSEVLEIFSPEFLSAGVQSAGDAPSPTAPVPPLIVELKVARDNAEPLCRAVTEALEGFSGEYCIESFDPRALSWFRKMRPEVLRGQLAENFVARPPEGLSLPVRVGATFLLGDVISRPDFIAYNVLDRHNPVLKAQMLLGAHALFWTIQDAGTMQLCEQTGSPVIFEGFVPGPVSEIRICL